MQVLVRIVEVPGGAAACDLVLEVAGEHTIGEVCRALGRHLGQDVPSLTCLRRGALLEPTTTVVEAGLINGDELLIGAGAAAAATACPAVASIDVVSGPESGRTVAVAAGTHSIGRGDRADIVIDDPTVSRLHAELVVRGDAASVRCTSSSNRVLVNDVEIGDVPSVLSADDLVAIGATRFVVREHRAAPQPKVDQLGQVDFHRTPYRPAVVLERTVIKIGPVPSRPDPRRFQMLSVIAPLAAGLVMFAFSRQVQFLALMLVSPVMLFANTVEDRRSGRRRSRDEVAAFGDSLATRCRQLADARDRERDNRRAAAPDLADLVDRATTRSPDLWARGRTAPDFLRLRLGLGTLPTRVVAEIDGERGDPELVGRAEQALAGLDTLDNVPVTVDLTEGVFGVHGDRAFVDGVVTGIVVQAACLHSPEDLAIVAAVDGPRLDWVKWFPHARSVTSPLGGPHLATDPRGADLLVAALHDVIAQRRPKRSDTDVPERWPHILAVFDVEAGADPAETARLLDLAPSAGISVVWVARRAADVVRQARLVLAVSAAIGDAGAGVLWSVDPAVSETMLEVDRLKRRIADRASRALAGVRDASTASLATSIPRAVGLLDVLDVGLPSGRWVTERWLAPSAYGLPFVIGAGAHGALGLDLVHDGPHALIGGTSGAGKSELLQSMVASLASRHPPDRLNFLFVDYKGGASSSVFERLPHTVGYVTNLDSALAVRALTSLRAELHHRMALLEGRAKDLAEMRIMAPAEAPPSLVIVVDEFATLVKEVPEFVAGIVDVAQRGRSLGIHLVLATQRPSGAVNENILANTNLRISLRMLDRAESSAVIGSPEAAAIPVPLRGRGLVRVGPTQLIPFQSAYGGALLTGVATRPPVLVGDFVAPHDQPVPITGGGVDAIGSTTQLVALIDAIVAAADMLRLPAPRRPWRDALADVVTLDSVLSDPACLVCCDEPGRTILVGMLDVPARQEQRPLLIDLEQGGGCLVFGSGGSGKTTLLRTVVAAAAATASPESIAVLGFDFASRGLASVGRLPHVVDVAGGDDLEAVTRHITVLEHEVARRRRMLADVNAEHLTAYHRHNRRLPRILLLVDGFGGATDVLGDSGGALSVGESWLDRLMRVIIDGRQVGVHAVITADRRNGVPSKLHAAISERIVLRQADEDGYSEHGVRLPAAAAPTLSPGRGRWQGDQEVQVAVVAVQHTAFDQQQALCALAARLGAATPDVLRSSALPDVVGSPTPAERGALRVALGVADVTGEWVDLDLTWSHAAVVGGPRSGRSTALASIAAGLRATADVYVVGPSSSPLAGSCRRSAFGRADRVLPLLDRLANLLELGRPTRAVALLVDDLDTFDDPLLSGAWERLAASDELRIVATLESRSLAGFSANPVIAGLRRARRLLVLRPDDPGEFLQLTGIKLPQRPGQRLVPGRGVYVADRVPHVVQVATPPDEPG